MAGRKKTGSKNFENRKPSGGKAHSNDSMTADSDYAGADDNFATDNQNSSIDTRNRDAGSDDSDYDNSAYENDFTFGGGERSEGGLKGAVGEGLKKLFAAGVSAAFMTEESVRSYLGDVKLPKEVLKLFVEGAAKSKEQLMNRVGNEVITIIQKIDFVKEASRFVETHKFRISAEVEVLKKDPSSSEQGRASFSVNIDKKSGG